MTASRFITNIQRKICKSLDLAFNTACLPHQWWSSHALGSNFGKRSLLWECWDTEEDMEVTKRQKQLNKELESYS